MSRQAVSMRSEFLGFDSSTGEFEPMILSDPSRSRPTALIILSVLLLFFISPCVYAWQGARTPAIRIIVVNSEAEAQRILERLNAGGDFAALAKEKSTDATADDGGYMGPVDPSTLRVELRQALQGVQPGHLSPIFKLPSGYAILKLESPTSVPALNPPAAATPSASSVAQPAPSPTGQGMAPTALLPLAGRGNIVFPPDVSGTVEVEMAFRKLPKPEDWNRDPKTICETRKTSLANAVRHLNDLLSPDDPESFVNTRPAMVGQVHFSLAQLLAYQGKMQEAIEHWQQAYQIAEKSAPQMLPELKEVLGTAYLHKSELENGIYDHPGERCLFPPNKTIHFAKTEDSEKAIQYFTKFLQEKPDVQEVRWLLNLAYMTVGKYPVGVPAKYLIAPSAFDSEQDIGRFRDVAPEAGVNSLSMGGGAIIDEFENNGWFDIVTSSYDACQPLHFYHNNGDGTFTDKAEQAGLGEQLGGLNIIQADYNNDGCTDIMVLRGAWQSPMPSSLLKNNCDGTFTDVTKQAGLDELTSSQTAVWADIDNDGHLDLFIANEQGPSKLYHNKGDGTFEDISHSAGIDRVAFSKSVVAGDYDNDGYMDFHVSNLGGNNLLYHNNHDMTFTEVGAQAGIQKPYMSFASWFFDYDNDGWPDLFITSYYMSPEEILRSQLNLPYNVETLKLYRNLGNGTFQDVTRQVGLDHVYDPMGSNFGDVDNDGYLDFYLGTGTPPFGDILPNVMFRNDGGKRFVNITSSSGTGDIHKGHGTAFADLDNDGNEDLVVEMGGAVPADRHALRLFENPGNSNDWISLHLVGVKSNRSAIGARIRVDVENDGQPKRSINRTVGSGGSFGASPLQQHVGLGHNARILNVEVWWPASNTKQTFSDVGKNQFLEIKEFEKNYTKLERKRVTLGGTKAAALPAKPGALSAPKK
jgi:tetratricopeptide (TPR) repeat protein